MEKFPSIKGQSFNSAKEYINKCFGSVALSRILNGMTGEDSAIVAKVILDVSWHPERTFINFLRRIEETCGKGDYAVCRQVGRFSAKEGVSRFYKIFISFGNPTFVIKRAPTFWSHIHDHGRLEIIEKGPNAAIAKLIDYKVSDKVFCHYLMGYFEGVLEMSGAREIAITEVKCVIDGGEYCEFIGSWEK